MPVKALSGILNGLKIYRKKENIKMSQRFNGKVKFYDAGKGFGFISPNAGGTDVFLHKTALEKAKLPGLLAGQEIEYSMEEGKKPGERARACALKAL